LNLGKDQHFESWQKCDDAAAEVDGGACTPSVFFPANSRSLRCQSPPSKTAPWWGLRALALGQHQKNRKHTTSGEKGHVAKHSASSHNHKPSFGLPSSCSRTPAGPRCEELSSGRWLGRHSPLKGLDTAGEKTKRRNS
jgi:hypothetical protein